MSTSYEELYSEYKNGSLSIFEGDEYYGDMLDAMEGGKHEISLFNRFFEKKIDLKWVEAIEACTVALDTIVRNPRKFIVQEEEIVPIERARKITAESVRHLAQHTSMIARVDGDRVTPSQILNVFREESFEIYENRFIFTLLRNLRHFIDTRYNVLFNMEQDEKKSSISMNSEFRAGNEKISYKLEVSSQAVSTMSATDAMNPGDKNATALARIERIKRVVNGFCSSSFMRDLEHCTPVRPPIMRTNVIQKDPNFRACLTLWQFISSYDEVGYEITAKETNEMVNDEYKEDLFRLATVNYMLLKKNTGDLETTGELKAKKRKLKPKLLKRLAEDLVLNYDMEEVEIRKVFVDELKRANKKKTAGETKINDAIDRALKSENDRKAEIEAKIKAEIQRQKEIEKRRKERERAKLARELAIEKERKAREKAKLKAKKEKEIALEKERKAKEKERIRKAKLREQELARLAKEKEKARLAKEKARAEKIKALEEEKTRKAALLAEQKKAKELAAQQAAKEKALAAKQKEKEKMARAKALQLEKERAAKAKQKEKERLAKQKAAEAQKAKENAEKQKAKEKAAKEKALLAEKEKAAKEKQKEKERLAKQKAAEAQKANEAAKKQKAKEKAAKEKALQAEKEKVARAKAKEKEKMAKQRALELEKERAAKAKQKAKEKAAREKALQSEKAKAAAQKAKDKLKSATRKADASTPGDSE